ncbi:hypothetical protein ACIHAX_24530 [Nocardia sp. NPDC051929]|uniref:hypothetical protein n=1 Tax=Nocardia sp. NPDC051929 TaxID=3364327 RepID=UPI0037C57A06
MSGWSEFGAALMVGAAAVAVLLTVFLAASRWWRKPLRGPSVYHIADAWAMSNCASWAGRHWVGLR